MSALSSQDELLIIISLAYAIATSTRSKQSKQITTIAEKEKVDKSAQIKRARILSPPPPTLQQPYNAQYKSSLHPETLFLRLSNSLELLFDLRLLHFTTAPPLASTGTVTTSTTATINTHPTTTTTSSTTGATGVADREQHIHPTTQQMLNKQWSKIELISFTQYITSKIVYKIKLENNQDFTYLLIALRELTVPADTTTTVEREGENLSYFNAPLLSRKEVEKELVERVLTNPSLLLYTIEAIHCSILELCKHEITDRDVLVIVYERLAELCYLLVESVLFIYKHRGHLSMLGESGSVVLFPPTASPTPTPTPPPWHSSSAGEEVISVERLQLWIERLIGEGSALTAAFPLVCAVYGGLPMTLSEGDMSD